MIEKAIDDYVKNIIEKMSESDSVKLKRALENLEEISNEIAVSYILKCAVSEITEKYLLDGLDRDSTDDVFADLLEQSRETIMELKDRYIFKVELKGYEDKINRIISVPAQSSLSDFCIGIVLSFHGEFSHLMQFKIGKKKYSIYMEDADYNEMDAREWLLSEIGLKKSTKIIFEYDFGAGYEFNVKLLGKDEDASLIPYAVVKDGDGYGIWEDHFYFLKMYYDNPDMSMLNYIGEDIPLKEWMDFDPNEFDSEEINEYINDYFIECKESCENRYE